MAGRQKVPGRFLVNEWIRVDRRKRRGNDRWDSNLETTFFVENLPEEVTNNMLWKAFGKVGRLSDAYAAKKKDSAGNRFGFLRFLNVKDTNKLLEKANEVRVMEAVVKVTVARFDRNHRKFTQQVERKTSEPVRNGRPVFQDWGREHGGGTMGASSKSFYSGGMSFKDAVINQQKVNPSRKSICITSEGGLLQAHWIGKVVVGEGKELGSLEETRMTLNQNGYQDVGIMFLGGMKVLVAFHDKKQALEFINNKKEVWERCFGSVRLWNGEVLPVERVVCVRIRGVPIQIRDEEVFNEIGGMFGRVVERSKFSWGNMDVEYGTCQAIVKGWDKVEEVINVVWRDRSFEVKVEEFGPEWRPEFDSLTNMEEGEFRQPSSERGEGISGEARKVGGEETFGSNYMHGEGGGINGGGGGDCVNNFNLGGYYESFEVGPGEERRKKRKQVGGCMGSPNKNMGLQNSNNDLGQQHSSASGLQGDGFVFGAGLNGKVGSVAPVTEVEGGSGSETRLGNSDVVMEDGSQANQNSASDVASEVAETIRVGKAMGVELEAFEKEVEELVSGDGVFEGSK